MKNKFRILCTLLIAALMAFAFASCEEPNDGEIPGPQPPEQTCTHENKSTVKEHEVLPTCTEEGAYDSVVYCIDCNAELSRDKIIQNALGHDEVSHGGKTPTCTEAGYAAYVECSRCEYTTYQPLDKLQHSLQQHSAKDPTCTEVGYNAYEECANCDYTTYEELPALNHDIQQCGGTEPNCTQPGCEDYEYCTRCEYTTYKEIPALDHKKIPRAAQDPTCEDFGWYAYEDCERCDWSSKFENLIDPLGHDYIDHDPKSETCTEDGWDAYQTCSRCDFSTLEDNIIEKRHLIETDYGRPATCTEIGWSIHFYCTRCDYKEGYVEEPALDHDYATMPGKAPTCTEGGWSEFRYCTRGDWSEERESQLGPLGHDIINHNAQEPTCEGIGWDAYETCSRCTAHNTYCEIDPIGHLPNDQSKAPTCEEDGYQLITCHRCEDFRIYEYREALGHDIVPEHIVEPTCTTVGYKTIEYCRRCYVLEHTPQIAPEPELLKTLDHNFVDGECTVCHNREGSAGLKFELGSDGVSYDLVGLGTCTDKIIVIPSTYNNLPVSGVAQSALANSDIVSVLIPNTISKDNGIAIDASVFMNCYHLVEIINNSDVDFEYFGYFLEEWIIAEDNAESKIVSVGDYYFYVDGGEALLISYVGENKDITLPANYNGGNYKIHNNAFRESGITSITVSTTVTEIGDWALYTANNVKCVTVNYLGTKAEWEQVTLAPDCKQWMRELVYHFGRAHDITHYDAKAPTCTEDGCSAYETCSMCDYGSTTPEPIEATGHFYEYVECRFCGKEIEYSEGLEYELSADGLYYIVTGIGTCTDDYIIIPMYYNEKPVKEIGEGAFCGEEFIGVNVPVTVEYIGRDAFSICYNLKYVSLGYNVKTIDAYAFGFCDKLVYITIGAELEAINSSAFYCCDALTDVYYLSSEEDWEKITISEYDNDCLTNANIHYNHTLPQ